MAPEEKQVQRWQTVQDGVDKLWLEQAPVPTPGKDEVLVEIRAVSLNYRDTEGMVHRQTWSRYKLDCTSNN